MTLTTVICCICTLIGTLLAIVGAIGRPLMENTKSMTALTEAVKNLAAEFQKSENNNYEAHKRIHQRIDDSEDDIKDHEKRIGILEAKGAK